MNAIFSNTAFVDSIPLHELAQRVPAAFAEHPAERTSRNYVFISTRELVLALFEAGFVATQAHQAGTRRGDLAYARHLLRFQHQRDSVTLHDVIPQIVLINSHDGRCAYQLRAGLYRPVCSNGLLARIGDFGLIHVPHRGDIVRNVVDAALELTRGFPQLGEAIRRMCAMELTPAQRTAFAQRALEVRYPGSQYRPYPAAMLLQTRRSADDGSDLWRVYNAVQQNLLRGGVRGVSLSGRSTRSRGIRAIREDVRINNDLWQLAMSMISAGTVNNEAEEQAAYEQGRRAHADRQAAQTWTEPHYAPGRNELAHAWLDGWGDRDATAVKLAGRDANTGD